MRASREALGIQVDEMMWPPRWSGHERRGQSILKYICDSVGRFFAGGAANVPESRTSMTATLLGTEFVCARRRDERTSLVMRGSVAILIDDILGEREKESACVGGWRGLPQACLFKVSHRTRQVGPAQYPRTRSPSRDVNVPPRKSCGIEVDVIPINRRRPSQCHRSNFSASQLRCYAIDHRRGDR